MEPVACLLVDDLEENLLALEGLLRRDDLVLLKARSGPEALELLLRHEVALALVDVQMPGMDGFELAEYMRGAERTRSVPIIFLTAGSTDAQRRFRGYEAGAVDFLQKPIDPHILLSKAQVFFELFRQRHEVARQRDELAQTMQENTRLLKESRQYAKALKEADRRKDEFLATLAHELRNPLAPIRNGLQLLSLEPRPTEEKATQVRNMMERQLSHLVRLIDDLLDMSRISKGKIALRPSRISVQSIVEFAVEASQPQIAAKHHHLVLDLPDETLWLQADMNRITQVLSNLLNNAAKYTERGGEIVLSARKVNEDAEIRVKDNGVGIPRQQLREVFELFSQIDARHEHPQGGLGIGLALAKRLVEMHEGTITVESPGPGLGSVFTVCLPLSPLGEEQAAQEAQVQRLQGKGQKVLVVDDNVASAETTGLLLETAGYRTVLAHDGLQALEKALAERPWAVLLDIGLPEKDGYEVCRELRRLADFEDTLIIAQTGLGQQRDRERAEEAGFDHYLVKPVSFQDMIGLLGARAATSSTNGS